MPAITLFRNLQLGINFMGIAGLVLYIMLISSANAQENKDVQHPDTTTNLLRLYGLELSLSKPEILVPSSQDFSEKYFPIYFRQSISTAFQIEPLPLRENLNIQSMWQGELAKQNEYRTLKVILGSIQVGGAAYLTYLYLKKYGFK